MHHPSKISLESSPPLLSGADFENAVLRDKKDYTKKLKKWQERLLHVQQTYYHLGKKALIVFEGWDAAGKGGAIRRLTEKMDPRGFTVVPVSAPTQEELSKHYLHRFFTHLPSKGTFTIFDRSYYGRVLVERVEGFAKPEEWERAYEEINGFERLIMDGGTRVIKIFLHITPEEQLNRFRERLHNPYKRWKITPEDLRNREKWPEYETAINEMFQLTSTQKAPWHLVPANRKWFARVQTLKIITKILQKGVDITPPVLDPELIKSAEKSLGIHLFDPH